MKKTDLLIFTKAPSAYEPSRFLEEGLKMGFSSQIVVYNDLDFRIEKNKIEIVWQGGELPSAKMVIFRAAGGEDFYIPQRDYLISYFAKSKAKVLNAATYKRWSRLDKLSQHFIMAENGIAVIDSTMYGLNERAIRGNRLYPSIIKYNFSSRGRDVFKLKKAGDLKKILGRRFWQKGYSARTMLLQPFLEVGQDLRLIVVGGKAIGAMKRIARPGKYLTNYSQGGLVENYDLTRDRKAQALAEETARLFDLDYVGVDLMADSEADWKVLEVNRACQFQGFEKATGINVPEKVINFLLK